MKKGTIITIVIAVLIIIGILAYNRAHPKLETNTDQTSNIMTTPSGLGITITKEGHGEPAKTGDTVSVNYTGKLQGGEVFDSNVDPKFQHVEPFAFTLGSNNVIQGWEEGVLGMKEGEVRHLVIPASLGYGAQGAGNVIPPNATLEFDVEAVSITRG